VQGVRSEQQAQRRARVVNAAMALAAKGGYEAVQMRAVSQEADVALGTIYRYFASKDHLLAEVVLAWGAELTGALRERELGAAAPAERVAEVLLFVLDAARAEPQLTSAVLTAATSPDPEAVRAGLRLGSVIGSYLGVALGDAAEPEHEELAQLLGHVFFSALVHMTSGRLSPEAAAAAVRAAARRLFPEGAPL